MRLLPPWIEKVVDQKKTKAYFGETKRITAVHANRSTRKRMNCRTSLDSIGPSSHRKDLITLLFQRKWFNERINVSNKI